MQLNVTKHKQFKNIFKLSANLFPDLRGTFEESFNETIREVLPKSFKIVQENISTSIPFVIRGMHWQLPPYAQAKFVHVAKGRIIDIFTDIRTSSKTFMQTGTFLLNQGESVYIPEGFAHGFLVLKDAVVQYKVNNVYNPETARSFNFKSLGTPVLLETEGITDQEKGRISQNHFYQSKQDQEAKLLVEYTSDDNEKVNLFN